MHMSADHDALIRRAKQLMAQKTAMLRTMEALGREMEQRLEDSGARIVRTRQLLAASAALLQQAKMARKAAPIPHEGTTTGSGQRHGGGGGL
jgi:hypothetical protein